MVMEFERSRRIDAPAGRVFAVAADRQTMDRWLPPHMHDVLLGGGRGGSVMGRYDISQHLTDDPDRKRLTWDDGNANTYLGWLQITDAGRRSQVTIHVATVNTEVGKTDVEYLLDQALRSLEKQVLGPRWLLNSIE